MTMTETTTSRRQGFIDRTESNLLSGDNLRLIARSNRSVRLEVGSSINHRGYGLIIQTLGRFAAEGDWSLAAVRGAIVGINPYLTPNEVVAQVAEHLAEFVSSGYFDVIGATGPGASRPSAYQHAITLRQALLLSMLMIEVEEAAGWTGSVPGVGWCVAALMERESMTFPQHLFPIHAGR